MPTIESTKPSCFCSQILASITGTLVYLACMYIHTYGKPQKKSHNLQTCFLLYNMEAERLKDSAPGVLMALLEFQLFSHGIGNPYQTPYGQRRSMSSVRKLARKVPLFQQYCTLANGLLKTEV